MLNQLLVRLEFKTALQYCKQMKVKVLFFLLSNLELCKLVLPFSNFYTTKFVNYLYLLNTTSDLVDLVIFQFRSYCRLELPPRYLHPTKKLKDKNL